jgi:hypothetical protein
MLNKCINLRFRKKQSKTYCYCTKKRAVIESFDCKGCLNKGYKKTSKNTLKTQNKTYSKLKTKTPIKKVSKKRITVSKKTYNKVYKRCNGVCAICGTFQYLEYHHIYYRSERPDLIDDPNNGIMLCGEFANNCHKGKAHKNKKYWQPILLDMVDKEKLK